MPKTVLITGGSSGVGAELVKVFIERGYAVWFTYNSGRSRADKLLESLPQGSKAKAFKCDQGSWEGLEALMQELPGVPDAVISNAALGSATVEQYEPNPHKQDLAMLQVNALGSLWLVNAVLPGMKARGSGKIVLVSSVGGGVSQFPGMRLADGMSKAAVAFLAKQLAAENTHTGVDVFCIAPGAIDTPMFQASSLNHLSEAQRAEFIGKLGQARLIPPREIAEQIAFLCSDAGRSLHGAVLDSSAGVGVRPGLFTEHSTERSAS
ncbi:hypothetical protein ABBQ38_009017 [Trebouxia sp. C0009 RCD-2024]